MAGAACQPQPQPQPRGNDYLNLYPLYFGSLFLVDVRLPLRRCDLGVTTP